MPFHVHIKILSKYRAELWLRIDFALPVTELKMRYLNRSVASSYVPVADLTGH